MSWPSDVVVNPAFGFWSPDGPRRYIAFTPGLAADRLLSILSIAPPGKSRVQVSGRPAATAWVAYEKSTATILLVDAFRSVSTGTLGSVADWRAAARLPEPTAAPK